MPTLVDHDFHVPEHFSCEQFTLEPLAERWQDADYEAVVRSQARIRHVFGPDSHWPSAELSFAENASDIAHHQREFDERSAFTYAILEAGGAYMGCLYVTSIKSREKIDLRRDVFGAEVYFWLSDSSYSASREALVFAAISEWLRDCWPFRAVAFPGRSISWDDWQRAAVDTAALASCITIRQDSAEPS